MYKRQGVTLELPGKKPGTSGGERRLGYPELGRGKVQVEFNRPGAKDADLDGDDLDGGDGDALADEAGEDDDEDEQS